MKKITYILSLMVLLSCEEKNQSEDKSSITNDTIKIEKEEPNKIAQFISENKDNGEISKSLGTVSAGKLLNGKLMPFEGDNFLYFDTLSYLNNRAFVNDKVKKTTLQTYNEMKKEFPERKFFLMECSNKNGGEIFPHRTHQNGLSIDFMMPLIKNNKPYYGLDDLGASHYWLGFDNTGKYDNDKSIAIDFNLVAYHILKLDEQARLNGLRVSKVLIKVELKDELYSTTYGQRLKNSGIYIAQRLTPLINSLHDDHYHVDFEIIK